MSLTAHSNHHYQEFGDGVDDLGHSYNSVRPTLGLVPFARVTLLTQICCLYPQRAWKQAKTVEFKLYHIRTLLLCTSLIKYILVDITQSHYFTLIGLFVLNKNALSFLF